MATAINCGFARVAVRELYAKHSRKQHAHKHLHRVVSEEYNTFFSLHAQMQLRESKYVGVQIKKICQLFRKRWHPQQRLVEYTSRFAMQKWEKLPTCQKQQHSCTDCQACPLYFSKLTSSFPGGKKQDCKGKGLLKVEVTKPSIEMPQTKLAKTIGHELVSKVSPQCEKLVGMPLSKVLEMTPSAGVQQRKTSAEKKKESRKRLRDIKNTLESEMRKRDTDLVFLQRLSYKKYNAIRMAEAFETPDQATERVQCQTPRPRTHGYAQGNLPCDTDQLLNEARTWSENEKVNWTKLADRYGITGGNRGQTIKEFLAKNEIPAAKLKQREFVRRAKLKFPGGEISHPTHITVADQKREIQQKIFSGELLIGKLIAPTQYTKYRVDKATKAVVETVVTVHGRQIPLAEIRIQMLKTHEEMGIIRASANPQQISSGDLETISSIRRIEFPSAMSDEQKRQLVCDSAAVRHLKVWHDHGKIAGHGHILVLIAGIFDPAFYLTTKELAEKSINLDVQTIVEKPEVHIIARCGSSDVEQFILNEPRSDCLASLSDSIKTSSGVAVTDTLRFFHGDGPAQQFEGGQSRGGNFPCVGCDALSTRFDDLAYAFRCQYVSLQERQSFMLQGLSWKQGGSRPLDNLKKKELLAELLQHVTDPTTVGQLYCMKKKQLEAKFNDLKRGIVNFPALLTTEPETSYEAQNLRDYEVLPAEPLHDFKGHMSNIIDALKESLRGEIKAEFDKVIQATLKETVRCVDLRKTAILLSNAFHKCSEDSKVCDLIDSVVEVCELMYAREESRTPTTILRLHNLTFKHSILCLELFGKTKSLTRRKMFGKYFHSISCHAAPLYRLVALRSLNTELQERLFNTCNDITKTTSNRQAAQLMNNIVIRVQQESKLAVNVVKKQEGEVSSLASTLPTFPNTVIPKEWTLKYPYTWQAHLERISDFLKHGPGVWWQEQSNGIQFFDRHNESVSMPPHPLHHFRTYSMEKEKAYLDACWGECIDSGVTLPLSFVRAYNDSGELLTVSNTESDNTTSGNDDREQNEQRDSDHDQEAEDSDDDDRDVINVREIVPEPAIAVPSQQQTYKCSISNQIATCLTDRKLVERFDTLRSRLKLSGRQSTRVQRRNYELVAETIKDKLVALHQALNTAVEDWEKAFVAEHITHPDPLDIPDHIGEKMRKRRTITKILRHEWKLTL